MYKFHVYLKNKLIDIIFYDIMDVKEIKKSLVEHDGYDPNIKVVRIIKI